VFVNIVRFPPIKCGKDAEFRDWFAWTNEEYAKQEGFVRRRLLKARDSDAYAAIVEHQSYETFMAMHTSPLQAEARRRVQDFLDGDPSPAFYDEVLG
jgi:heme-degrading monooxygenase HmoA